MLTSKDLAALAGVSQITVSRALNNSPLVKEETKKRILRLAKEHHYELNSFAQSMRTNKTGSIGLMLAKHFTHTNQNLYASSMLSYLLLELESSGYDIIPTTNRNTTGERSHIENIMAKRKIDGLIVIRNDVSNEVFEMLDFYEIPCVFITQLPPGDRIHYSIQLDHYRCGYLVGEHFGKQGMADIATISGPSNSPDTIARLKGLTDGLSAYGIELNHSRIFYGDYSFSGGYDLTLKNLEILRHCAGIYYQNDPSAIGGIKVFREHQINLNSFNIISGDGTPITQWFSPALSTIYAPAEKVAKEAVDLICRLLRDKNSVPDTLHTVISPELILRET